jgi:hypothetical protein
MFFMFSSVTASFGRPLRSSSSMLISPRLNLANHFSTVDFAGAESVYQAKPYLASIVYFFAKKQWFINKRNSFLSIFSQ